MQCSLRPELDRMEPRAPYESGRRVQAKTAKLRKLVSVSSSRTLPKSSQPIAFIFFSISVGGEANHTASGQVSNGKGRTCVASVLR